MTKGSPVLTKALEVLADGEWHDMAEVLLTAMRHVEPSKAIRRAEADRQLGLTRAGKPRTQPRKKLRDKSELQQIGARSIARETIFKTPRVQVQWLGKTGEWVDVFDPEKVARHARARIRLRPGYTYNSRSARKPKPEEAADPPLRSCRLDAYAPSGAYNLHALLNVAEDTRGMEEVHAQG